MLPPQTRFTREWGARPEGAVATGVFTVGAVVSGLDLSPVLLEHAAQNAAIAGLQIEFMEGDAEALPYPDATFDVVLSQFGHMFAPIRTWW